MIRPEAFGVFLLFGKSVTRIHNMHTAGVADRQKPVHEENVAASAGALSRKRVQLPGLLGSDSPNAYRIHIPSSYLKETSSFRTRNVIAPLVCKLVQPNVLKSGTYIG